MTFPFKLRIYDMHEREGGEEDGWLRFDFMFDVKDLKIVSFREFILFDGDNPVKCTWIFFDDGDSVYGCYSFDKFMEIYNNEYTKAYTDWLVTKMKLDGQIEEPKKWYQFWKA